MRNKKLVENRFRFLCDALGKKIGYAEGEWSLDYVPQYGGVVIQERIGASGITHPFGHERYKPIEFVQMVQFALRAVALDRGQADHIYWPSDKIKNEEE